MSLEGERVQSEIAQFCHHFIPGIPSASSLPRFQVGRRRVGVGGWDRGCNQCLKPNSFKRGAGGWKLSRLEHLLSLKRERRQAGCDLATGIRGLFMRARIRGERKAFSTLRSPSYDRPHSF